MSNWKNDKRWSDRFLPEIKGIIGTHLITEPPYEEDAERNTDLMVLRLDAIRIGCRVRKFKFSEAYPNEFTIRTVRPSGAQTELGKIIEGWGDYFFYGFADAQESGLFSWALCDLKKFLGLGLAASLCGIKERCLDSKDQTMMDQALSRPSI